MNNKKKNRILPRIKRPRKKLERNTTTEAIASYLKDTPPLMSIYFPDHDNKVLWYSFDDNTRMSDLIADVIHGPQSPVAPNMHVVYSLCIPKNKATNEERLWIPPESDQMIWSYFIVSHEIEYRMLPRNKVDKLNLPDLYLRITAFASKSIYLLKVPHNSTCDMLLNLLYDEVNVNDEEQPGFGLYWNEKLLLGTDNLTNIGIQQMENIVFKRQYKYILRTTSIVDYKIPLSLPGDILVSKVIEEIILWLNLNVSPHDVGLLLFNSSLNYDKPIIPWLPITSSLIDWDLQSNDSIQLKSIDPDVMKPITIIFISTPDILKRVGAAAPEFFISCEKHFLLNGEHNIAIFNSVCDVNKESTKELHRPRTVGTLFITNYRILLNSFRATTVDSSQLHSVAVNITLGEISRIELGKEIITISCKNLRVYGFQSGQASQIFKTLEELLTVPINSCFAFEYSEKYPETTNGWDIYNFRKEMTRQGIPNSFWRIESTNIDYKLSPTYPREYVVPTLITSDKLKSVYSFRSKGRIPVLTYLHPYGGSISRCSQPLVGLTSKSSTADKNYIDKIRATAANSSTLWMFDARPKASAVANRVLDGGYESNYNQCKLQFCNIDNIHVMRHSFKEFSYACNDNSNPYLPTLAQSKWLEHTLGILIAAHKAAKLVLNGYAILVHCSDGWDRTPQICSMAQIFLDPYYRTIEGFQVLIEKDWCSFGHKFSQRLGHCTNDYADSERSPVFQQFMECVWHIKEQFPDEFEFNTNLLKCILHHSTSCRFGTFLYDNDKERKDNQVNINTISLWTFINNNLAHFTNYLYDPSCSTYLKPFLSDRALSIWKEVYCHQSDYSMRYIYHNQIKDEYITKLNLENQLLTDRLNHLETIIKNQDKSEKMLKKISPNLRNSLCCISSGGFNFEDSDEESE